MATNEYDHKSGYVKPELQILNNSSRTGYAVNTPNSRADKSSTYNGVLMDYYGKTIKLWITDVSADFSLSGTTGQSRYRRQFYPKAFNQPSLSIVGRTANQAEYNRLAAFFRETHSAALTDDKSLYERQSGKSKKIVSKSSTSPQLVKFLIRRSGKNFINPKRNLKGSHQDMLLEGYVTSIAAGATKFNFAPEFQFNFIVAQSYDTAKIGIWSDELEIGSQLSSWMDQFKNKGFGQQKFASSPSTKTKSTTSGRPVRGEVLGPVRPAYEATYTQSPHRLTQILTGDTTDYSVFGPTR